MKLEFSRQIFEKVSYIKIRLVGTEFHAGGQTDGWTDTTKLIVAFRNSANAPDKRCD
jgi:hypothetical protein